MSVSSAADVPIPEVLARLDAEHAEFARAFAQGQYALWIGSGISMGRVEGLKPLVLKLLVGVHERWDQADPDCPYGRALGQILAISNLRSLVAAIDKSVTPLSWVGIGELVADLVGHYAAVLDVRVDSCDPDHLLWDIVDVRAEYASDSLKPAGEHLAIALLLLEGAAPEIASANWDGLIELAVEQLSSRGDALQVCVLGVELVGALHLGRLLKFHGCALRAKETPADYRQMLIHQDSQLTSYGTGDGYGAMRVELVSLATRKPTLMIGLSAQDADIKRIFADAGYNVGWTWPSTPPRYICAEESLGASQGTILRTGYGSAYDANPRAIDDGSVVRAYAEPLLVALLLHLYAQKVAALLCLGASSKFSPTDVATLLQGVLALRDRVSESAEAAGDMAVFLLDLVAHLGGVMWVSRHGTAFDRAKPYAGLTPSVIHQALADPNVTTSGLPALCLAVGLLGAGDKSGDWIVSPGVPEQGSLAVASTSGDSRIHLAMTAGVALTLQISGLVEPDATDVVVVHGGSAVAAPQRSPRSAPGRTGASKPRYVAMDDLVEQCSSEDELRVRFREEACL